MAASPAGSGYHANVGFAAAFLALAVSWSLAAASRPCKNEVSNSSTAPASAVRRHSSPCSSNDEHTYGRSADDECAATSTGRAPMLLTRGVQCPSSALCMPRAAAQPQTTTQQGRTLSTGWPAVRGFSSESSCPTVGTFSGSKFTALLAAMGTHTCGQRPWYRVRLVPAELRLRQEPGQSVVPLCGNYNAAQGCHLPCRSLDARRTAPSADGSFSWTPPCPAAGRCTP